MLPLAHIGIIIFFASLFFLPIMAALVGGIIPDIVDKIFFKIGITPCGRFFAHSLFFGPLIAIAAFIITRRADVSLAILFGSYLHLLQDARAFLPLFYPFVNYDFYCLPTAIKPDLIDLAFESIGAFLIPVTFVLKPKIGYFKKLVSKREK